jgi:K+-transporting ATPase ATPase C chain
MNTQAKTTGEFPAIPDSSLVLDQRGGGLGTATRFALVAILAFGLLLPLVGVLLGQTLFPAQAHGSLIDRNGKVLGSALIAQPFADNRYFRPRPSALRERIAANSAEVVAREHVAADAIPSDLVTASGSGMDPHISPAAAALQVARVARTRHMEPERVQALVAAHTEAPTFGVFGQARVNVLQLNLALDEASP